LTKQENELITQAKSRLAKLVQRQKNELQEKQEIQKKVLEFLHAI
jgi:hypothetical protein